MSIVTRSYGSWVSPSTVRSRTSGREAVSSKPSRRICSMRTASWSSPRPRTSNASAVSAGRTSIETLPRTSFSRRALIWRLVTYLPSRPASGEVLTPNVMRSVGASTSSRGSGRGSAGSVSVSPIVTSGRPGDADDVAGSGLGDVDAVDAVGGLQARHDPAERHRPARLHGPGRVVGLLAHDRDALADPDPAVPDAPDGHPPDVVVGAQVRDEELERVVGRVGRRRGDVDEQVEQRAQVLAGLVERRSSPCPALAFV